MVGSCRTCGGFSTVDVSSLVKVAISEGIWLLDVSWDDPSWSILLLFGEDFLESSGIVLFLEDGESWGISVSSFSKGGWVWPERTSVVAGDLGAGRP